MPPIQRPAMSRDLYRPSHLWAIAYLTYAACLFMLPALACYQVALSSLATPAQIALIAPLTVLAAYGLNMMGFVGHEGTHGNLFRNRRLSALTGIFYASSVLTYFEMGFAISHWNHHRFTNQPDDPDIGPVRGLTTWWQRLLFSRLIYNTLYFKHTCTLARGKQTPFKYKAVYSHRDQVLFARANLLFALLWVIAYGAVFAYDWRAGLFCVILPTLTVNFIGACQIYIDHAGLGDGVFANAWSRTSPIMTILFFGANYHMEHHAYPGIPCYRLPKVHRILRENGTYTLIKPPVVHGFFEAFKPLSQPYQSSSETIDFNAFEPALVLKRADEVPLTEEVLVGQTRLAD